jgi:sphingomyelin phosphodiesterase 2
MTSEGQDERHSYDVRHSAMTAVGCGAAMAGGGFVNSVTVVSFNTRGVPLKGSGLARRYAAIGAGLEAGDAAVACLQEVLTYWHLGLLARRMRSFRHVSYRPSAAGPAGGLVTFSRLPATRTNYRRFGRPPKTDGVPRLSSLQARLKGALVTRLANPGLTVVNVHPVANRDGDWSAGNRFYPLHRAQLASLVSTLGTVAGPAVVCGDFNIDRESSLFAGFVSGTGLSDVFEGRCPPTFRAEYLPAGATPHCIDFILTSKEVRAEDATVVFAERSALPGGPEWLSDHVGLRARLSVSSS